MSDKDRRTEHQAELADLRMEIDVLRLPLECGHPQACRVELLCPGENCPQDGTIHSHFGHCYVCKELADRDVEIGKLRELLTWALRNLRRMNPRLMDKDAKDKLDEALALLESKVVEHGKL